ncbi:succinate dehydrogenase assembly factor 2 [Corticibacter populi]|uniref:FAD assembly factor SdhE n=1 Tax=Corticibacter populi TaxID=1550736 RepID=A0A3M6QTT0_9BURK|nr:succinate dehydrogenase assembly factor 2 [Corticibacter populi]RMX06417.1 succinate dehydrogenase assembly factor 2 [Corticibacter populi]RZS32036.1 antitoxin CptB [Corticibacter populi]
MPESTSTNAERLLTDLELRKLHWRSRRGLLENDLLIEKFFADHGIRLNLAQGDAVTALMNLADNDLLDLLLRRKELQGDLDTPLVQQVLDWMRPPPVASGAHRSA